MKMQIFLEHNQILTNKTLQEYLQLFREFTEFQNKSEALKKATAALAQNAVKKNQKSASRHNDPYGVDLAYNKDGRLIINRKSQNRFKVIKKQNIENTRLQRTQKTPVSSGIQNLGKSRTVNKIRNRSDSLTNSKLS